jgi:ureidoacrylate peracid hydrolase
MTIYHGLSTACVFLASLSLLWLGFGPTLAGKSTTSDEKTGPDLTDVKPGNSALLVIDMSRDFVAPGAPLECAPAREMAKLLAVLLERCRKVGLPIIYVNHVHHPGAKDMGTLAQRFPAIGEGKALRAGTPGVEIWAEISPEDGDIVIEKIRQSGFAYTSLEARLRELGVRNVIVSGVSVGACVECTARDAVARDFHVIMLSDGTETGPLPDLGWGEVETEVLKRVFYTNFAYHFGRVASIDEVLHVLSP